MIPPSERLRIYDRLVYEGNDPDDASFELKLVTLVVEACKASEGVTDCFACRNFDRCNLRKNLRTLNAAAKR